MSQENVEIVRNFFAATERAMALYWVDPSSIASALGESSLPPEGEEVFAFVHPDIIWNAGGFGSFRGHDQMAAAWDDIFDIADEYSVSVIEMREGRGGLVYAAVERAIRAKGSGIQTKIPVFSVVKLDDGLIVQLDEFANRHDALKAAGLSE
jgi:limonene-1,2-epoxide hydrolase